MGYYDEGMGRGWDSSRNRSVNAVRAEDRGLLPLSRWKEMSVRQTLEHIATYYDIDFEAHDNALANNRKSAILKTLRLEEAHHVGIFHKLVDYYGVDEDLFNEKFGEMF